MDNRAHPIDEKRECTRSAICRKIRFIVGTHVYSGLIGDVSFSGMSIISRHEFILGSVVDLKIPAMSGTVQYCVPYGKGFFKAGLRLLENNR